MWYTIKNKYGNQVIVREITEQLALSKAASLLKREAKLKGVKGYKHTEAYWTELEIVEVTK